MTDAMHKRGEKQTGLKLGKSMKSFHLSSPWKLALVSIIAGAAVTQAARAQYGTVLSGAGAFAVAGFGVNYAGSTFNPLLTAPPPAGLGFGPIYSDFQVLQLSPAVAYRITERLSVGVGPIVDLATLKLAPALFAAPDNAN